MKKHTSGTCIIILLAANTVNAQVKQKNNSEDWSEKLVIVTPGLKGKALSDAVVLFNKNNLDQRILILQRFIERISTFCITKP